MPIYEYQCQNCGHQLEAFQKISEEPLKLCPKCNQSMLQRLVSATSFQLKGSGWYATDYGTKPKPKSDVEQSKDKPPENKSESDAKTKNKVEKTSQSDDKAV